MIKTRKLIVPAAGRSNRYGGEHKFLLRHPTGRLMLEVAISSIGARNLESLDEVIVISRHEILEDSGLASHNLEIELSDSLGVAVRVHLLDAETRSMVETITRFVETEEQDAAFIVRDTDNFVSLGNENIDTYPANFMTYADLRKFPTISAANKGFLQIDGFGQVIGVVEKQIVGPLVYVGMSGFESYSRFLYASRVLGESPSEHYITDIIRTLISDGLVFGAKEAEDYLDWGTEQDWSREISAHRQFVCDFEGFLADCSPATFQQLDRVVPTQALKDLSSRMRQNPRFGAVVFTSIFPPESFPNLLTWLAKNGLDEQRINLVNAPTGTPKTLLGHSKYWD